MRLPFELFLALRYLRPKRTFFSVITLLSIVGVMLGVAVLIIVMSVMTGFDHELRSRILTVNPPISIYPRGKEPLTNYVELMERVRQNPAVRGAAPIIGDQTMARTESPEDETLLPAYVKGVVPRYETNVSTLLDSVVEGEPVLRGNGILVGREMADSYGLQVGDSLAIYSIATLKKMYASLQVTNGQAEAILPGEFEIRGIFDVNFYEFNASLIVCSLANAQELFGYRDEVRGVAVQLHDPLNARGVRNQLQTELGEGFYLATPEDDPRLGEYLAAVTVEKNVMFYLLFFIMVVAAFGITSVLITFVIQKTREIGMLKALGATSRQVTTLFLAQSCFVGLMGVMAGIGLGLLAIWYRNEFLFFLRRAAGVEIFPAKIYNFSELPAQIVASDIAFISGGSLFICLLAGLLPAWNASRFRPVDALRHE